jgi:hypothetical protein
METVSIKFEDKDYELNFDPEKDCIIIDLDRPLSFGQEKYTQIELQAPTWEILDSIDLTKMNFANIRKLASKMSGLDSIRLGKIKGGDIKKIMVGVMYFLQQSLGETK